MTWRRCEQCPVDASPITTFLYGRETQSCMVLVDYEGLLHGRIELDTCALFVFETDGDVEGVSLYYPTRQELLVTSMPICAVELLVEQLSRDGSKIDQFIGPVDICAEFETSWTRRHEVSVIHSMLQGVYELRTLTLPPADGGRLRNATPDDVDLASQYIHEFGLACFPAQTQSRTDATKAAVRLIQSQRLFFWVDQNGEVVSMAAKVRETRNVAGISLVYTPSKCRKRGYAARVVGYLSQALLDGGKAACMLYTDLSNPTSNGVYLGLGYRQLTEQRIVRFTKPE